MNKFAFVLNPFNVQNIHDYCFISKLAPQALIKVILRLLPPFKIHHAKNMRSAAGAEIEGCFIVCPLLSKQVLAMKEETVLNKILKAVRLGERSGAKVIGLGALMGIIGKGGKSLPVKPMGLLQPVRALPLPPFWKPWIERWLCAKLIFPKQK